MAPVSQARPRLVPLTHTVQRQLADLYGSPENAEIARRGGMPARKPAGPGQPPAAIERREVIISDLRLGAGTDPVTRSEQPGENFSGEQARALSAWLANEWLGCTAGGPGALDPARAALAAALRRLTWSNGQPIDLAQIAKQLGEGRHELTLCINGDFLDLLRTSSARPGVHYPDGHDEHGAPRNTPANALVTLNTIHTGHPEVFRRLAAHLRLGHKLDIIPGDHDRALANDRVWEGQYILPNGKLLTGFTGIIRQHLRALGASPAETLAALRNLRRLPFSVAGDVYIDHGDMADAYGRVQRPLKEFIEPSDWHQPMELAFADLGVRSGVQMPLDQCAALAAIAGAPQAVLRGLHRPLDTIELYRSFLAALEHGGHAVSPAADADQRMADIEALVAKYPALVDELNRNRPPTDRLSPAQVAAGLKRIEAESATPLLSNFKKGTGWLSRLGELALGRLRGTINGRSAQEVNAARGRAAQLAFRTNGIAGSDEGRPRSDLLLTEDGQELRRIAPHCWGRGGGRGVAVVESGTTSDGKPWTEFALGQVVDGDGTLAEGSVVAEVDPDPENTAREVARIAQARYVVRGYVEPAPKTIGQQVQEARKALEVVRDALDGKKPTASPGHTELGG